MPPIYLGENEVDYPKIKLGNQNVLKIYQESTIVYMVSSGTPPPPKN